MMCNSTDECSCIGYPSFTSSTAVRTLVDSGVTPLTYNIILFLIGLILLSVCCCFSTCARGKPPGLSAANVGKVVSTGGLEGRKGSVSIPNRPSSLSVSGLSMRSYVSGDSEHADELVESGMKKVRKKRVKYQPHNVRKERGRHKHKDQIIDPTFIKVINETEWSIKHDSDPRIQVYLCNHVELFDRIFEGNIDFEEVDEEYTRETGNSCYWYTGELKGEHVTVCVLRTGLLVDR